MLTALFLEFGLLMSHRADDLIAPSRITPPERMDSSLLKEIGLFSSREKILKPRSALNFANMTTLPLPAKSSLPSPSQNNHPHPEQEVLPAEDSSYDPKDVSQFQTTNETMIDRSIGALLSPSIKEPGKNDVNHDLVVYNYRKGKNPSASTPSLPAVMFPLPKVASTTYNASAEIVLFDATLKRRVPLKEERRVDFIVDTDKSEVASLENGKILLQRNINNEHSIVSGLLEAKGKMRTRVEVPLVKNEHFALEVSLLDREDFFQFLEERDIPDYGGHLLVEISDESIHDISIDTFYREKIFLDSNLERVSENELFHFVLFLHTNPGNVTITYGTSGGEANKVVHLHPDEIFFDYPILQEEKRRNFNIREHALLSGEYVPLGLQGKKIRYFTSEEESFNHTLGSYLVKIPTTTRTARSYISIDRNGNNFLVGTTNDTITIPDQNRLETYLHYMGIDTLDNTCVTQVDFQKIPANVAIDTSTQGVPALYDSFYVAPTGEIVDSFETPTKTMFLVGDGQGISRIKVTYGDETIDYLQTFCNDSIYILEHL